MESRYLFLIMLSLPASLIFHLLIRDFIDEASEIHSHKVFKIKIFSDAIYGNLLSFYWNVRTSGPYVIRNGLAGGLVWQSIHNILCLMFKLTMMNLSSSEETGKICWDGSQADFITLVEFFEATGAFQGNGERATIDQIGELFMNIIDIDISPFTDFRSMRMSVGSNMQPREIAKLILDKLDEEEYFDEALAGTGVAPSPEEQISKMTNWMVANDFVTKLAKYADFKGG